MRIFVGLDNGLLPDRFGKHAPEAYQLDGHPVRSFPIEIADVPEGARSLALTFLDYDAVPVGGFCWIHWLACDIAPDTTLVPENASASGELACVQGSNSDWSPLAGSHTDPRIIHRYAGPYPPDKAHDYTLTVYALDCELGLSEATSSTSSGAPFAGMCWTRLRSSCPAAHRGGLVEAVRIEHPLEPIYAVDSRVLVLGTMPSPKSREIGFYYGHPQNRFWKVMARCSTSPSRSASRDARRFSMRTASLFGTFCRPALSSELRMRASSTPLRTIFRALPRRRRSKPCSPRARRRRRSIAASARRSFPALRTRDFLPPVLRTRACASTIS